ncbi:MAG: response regulator, partial [Deltaproteobacteria bacterium]|nr:response regulator [Deltaproteobacteria bacterium]
MADPTQFHQILMNLCTNAGHAMQKDGGDLEIRLKEIFLHKNNLSVSSQLKSGPYLRLTVKDTGHGISKDNLGRIFEPYFTTKGQGEGTGLGLAVVHGIVKDHGGDINAYSEIGKGTIFNVLLPLIYVNEETAYNIKTASLPTGSETILFVDDEQELTNLSKRLLERLGYKVVTHTNSEKALAEFKQSADSYDLVITDKTMPHLTGYDLSREILSIKSDIPIIL